MGSIQTAFFLFLGPQLASGLDSQTRSFFFFCVACLANLPASPAPSKLSHACEQARACLVGQLAR